MRGEFPDVHWCYMSPLLQLLHLLQGSNVQQVETVQRSGLIDDDDDDGQSLFCGRRSLRVATIV